MKIKAQMFRNIETNDYLCTDKTILIWQQDLSW